MQVTLVIPALTSGGAERVLVMLAQGFLQRGHSVTVITLSSKDTDFYSLPPAIERVALNLRQKSSNLMHGIWNTIVRLMQLRQVVRETQPDIVISFMASMNIFTTIALFKTKLPVIGTEHCSAKMFPCGQPWELFRRPTYRGLHKLVSVSQGVDSEMAWLPKAKRTVIYNPFLLPKNFQDKIIHYPNGVNPDKKWIITMGRLIPEKGFDLMLTAFQKIADRYPEWQLLILGEGELRHNLEILRENLGLSESVVFTGSISNPFPFLKHSQLFVLSSQTEGFPMSLGEALACGLPVIATNCSSGIRELMRDGIDGILIPNQDVAALAAAMERLMSDELERNRLATLTVEVLERFSLDKVLDEWETLIDEILKERHLSAT
jgi:GalNAc-alpha-(1->4)-GalNAc-alpha-(1->3)-diNAcBac-PP-undecaprenol alpha-1,4-N-acetyl-D-galactosaminyltransferase